MYDRIKKLCKEKHTTIQKLEAEIGFSNGTINKWDEKRPSVDKVKLVADFFGVSMEYIVTGIENAPATTVGNRDASKDQRLIDWFRSLPEEKQKAILISQDGPEDVV